MRIGATVALASTDGSEGKEGTHRLVLVDEAALLHQKLHDLPLAASDGLLQINGDGGGGGGGICECSGGADAGLWIAMP